MDSVNVRNLEQIQEAEGDGRSAKVATILLASVGGAAVVMAAVLTSQRGAPPSEAKGDPLAALVAKAKHPEANPPDTVQRSEVTFPSILSDSERPTTALAAVKDERGRLIAPDPLAQPEASLAPPPPADRLPVVPLPAGTLLDATPVTKDPKDGLTALAAQVSRADTQPPAMAGMEGGFQLQVASFKDQADADRFVAELQKRGHRAYRQASYVGDRGLWHRVRIGPFKSKLAAEKYKADFDQKERMSAFLVDPEKVKRAEEMKAMKLAQRTRTEEQ
ncbi:MAG TPA: SPOR domain-containing protein [Polyangiaceae bacterium]|nr:SPOR domain-containing protein [Polyangiaceae bacterium]